VYLVRLFCFCVFRVVFCRRIVALYCNTAKSIVLSRWNRVTIVAFSFHQIHPQTFDLLARMLRAAARLSSLGRVRAVVARWRRSRFASAIAPRLAAASRRGVLAAGVACALALAVSPASPSFAAAGNAGAGAGLAATLKQADVMYDNPAQYTRQQLYDTLARIDRASLDAVEQAEVLWRLTRATYELAQEPTLPKDAKAALIREAYAHVQVGVLQMRNVSALALACLRLRAVNFRA
jgi:hypothetical protein